MSDELRVYSPKELSERLGLSQRTIWRQVQAGKLAEPQRLSARRVGWTAAQVEEFLDGWRARGPEAGGEASKVTERR